MSAICASLSPATPNLASPGGNEVLAFHVAPNSNLALDVLSTDSPGGSVSQYSAGNSDNVQGRVQNASLATAQFRNMIGVYGVIETDDTSANKPSGQLALLSPAFQPLGLTCEAIYGRVAACEDSKHGRAWIYYRKLNKQGTALASCIWQSSLVSAQPNERAVFTLAEIDDTTFLAAYYDQMNDHRHVIYQYNMKIFDFNIDNGDNINTQVQNSSTSTGIAVVYVAEKRQTYLYYVTQDSDSKSDYLLYKSVKSWDESKQGFSWGAGGKVTPERYVRSDTQLSAISVPAARENYVIYYDVSGNIDYIHCKW